MVVAREPYEWVPSRATLEEWAGSRVGPLLGCGAWGCAFQLADGRVLKATRDDEEVAGVVAVEEVRSEGISIQGIARIFEMPGIVNKLTKGWWIRLPDGRTTATTVFLYVREYVEPLPNDYTPEMRYRRGKTPNEYDESALGVVTKIGFDIMHGKNGKLPALQDEYMKWCEIAAGEFPFRTVAESLLRLADNADVYLTDVDINNIGLNSSGTPVLFDFMLARPFKKVPKKR